MPPKAKAQLVQHGKPRATAKKVIEKAPVVVVPHISSIAMRTAFSVTSEPFIAPSPSSESRSSTDSSSGTPSEASSAAGSSVSNAITRGGSGSTHFENQILANFEALFSEMKGLTQRLAKLESGGISNDQPRSLSQSVMSSLATKLTNSKPFRKDVRKVLVPAMGLHGLHLDDSEVCVSLGPILHKVCGRYFDVGGEDQFMNTLESDASFRSIIMQFMNERRKAIGDMGREAFDSILQQHDHSFPPVSEPNPRGCEENDWIDGHVGKREEFCRLLHRSYPRDIVHVPRCDLAWAIANGDNKLFSLIKASTIQAQTSLRSAVAQDIHDAIADELAEVESSSKRKKITPETLLRSFYEARLL